VPPAHRDTQARFGCNQADGIDRETLEEGDRDEAASDNEMPGSGSDRSRHERLLFDTVRKSTLKPSGDTSFRMGDLRF
jgi:hypothetical protein